LTCGHFIDMAFMITKLWLRFYGVKTCCNMVEVLQLEKMPIRFACTISKIESGE
jgi:hypothetical protein